MCIGDGGNGGGEVGIEVRGDWVMKTVLTIILLFAFVCPCLLVICGEKPACAELTEKDIQQIRQIIREEIEPLKIEIATVKLATSAFARQFFFIPLRYIQKADTILLERLDYTPQAISAKYLPTEIFRLELRLCISKRR